MTAPRRENIPGYSANCRDSCNWEEAARALRVSPFYDGPDAVPFSRLRATQVPDPAEAMCRSTTSISTTAEQRAKR